MKNEWLLICCLIIFFGNRCSKEKSAISNCGVLNKDFINHYRDTLLVDYVSRKYPTLKEYLIERKDSKLLRTQSCSDSLVIIK
jgi:hypothetical protein